MKKLFIHLFLILPISLIAQKTSISPILDQNVIYQYSIHKYTELVSPRGKINHQPANTHQEIELAYIFNDGKDKIFSWKIIDFQYKEGDCKKCDNQNKNKLRNNTTVLVRLDSLGRYKTINNLSQVKQNILNNILELEKTSSKKEKEYFTRIKKLPEIIISIIEEDIIIFFRYYGLETKNFSTTLHARRTNFPFGIHSPPFKTEINISNQENEIKINVENTFDKNLAKDEDYNMIKFNQNLKRLKSKYNLTAQEEYVFSKENFRILYAKISATEFSNFHENGIFKYQYTITQKK